MAGSQCNKFRGDKVKVILVLGIKVMLQVLDETMQVDRKGLLNATTVKDKAMLSEAQEAGKFLDEKQLVFLADPGVPNGQAVQTIIPNNEVAHSKTYLNDMENQSVHAMQDFEQSSVMDLADNEMHKKEDKNKENEMDLEKKIKELDNFIFKVGQSAHTVHMLIKPQAFYDNIHKQALETLILEEVSRSKMSEKEKDPNAIKRKISNNPIDYVKLNKLYEDFGKRFVPQQELSADESLWYHMLNPFTKSYVALPVKIEAPKELLKYLDFGCSKHMTRNCSHLMNFVSKVMGTVRFRNYHIARIIGYGDYQLGNVNISKVYYIEGLGHNLFSIGQFCDANLEVAFRKNTGFIRNLEGVDLLFGS
nr:integrase, catalytic region, zinc finger, CCHC-type, peptidase aspartic, catalytic [Tanacetum cinerariifolium]